MRRPRKVVKAIQPGRLRDKFGGAIAILLLLAIGCQRPGTTSDDSEGAPPAAEVVMTVKVVKARRAPMRQQVRLLGVTVALRHITLRAPTAGRVLGLTLESGDRVHRGEVVAHVVSREVEAAENGLAIARKLDPNETAKMTDSVKRYVHGTGVAVTVPEDAIVAQRLVSSGQMIADLDPLADLIDPRSIYVEASVPTDQLAAVRPGMPVQITSPMDPGISLPGRIAALLPSLSPGGATAPVRVEFTSGERIEQAGAPVELEVTTASIPDAIVIPNDALFQEASTDSYYVFTAGADHRAHRHSVTVGIRTPQEVQVTSGVGLGDFVITSGGYALSDGLKISIASDNQ